MEEKQTNYVLMVKDLRVSYAQEEGGLFHPKKDLDVLKGVSFSIREGEVLGLVGESGCGKSTLSKALLGLIPKYEGVIVQKSLHPQMIFQDPYSSLDPRMSVHNLIAEPVQVCGLLKTKAEINEHVREIMDMCGLPADQANLFPHELDGGLRQRVGLARAMAVSPKFIVCDEPVSALDVSIQAQIINLLKNLQKKYNLTYLFISHDLSVVEYISDTVGVMYLGNLVEYGATEDIFRNPLHPYTKALFSAIPVPDPTVKMDRIVLEGSIPSPANPPAGCKFHTRCANCMEKCKTEVPQQREIEPGHYVVCHLYDEA